MAEPANDSLAKLRNNNPCVWVSLSRETIVTRYDQLGVRSNDNFAG